MIPTCASRKLEDLPTRACVVLIVALVVVPRLAYLATVGPLREIDTTPYLVLGNNLASHGTFSFPDDVTGRPGPCTLRVPLFPAMVAALQPITGPDALWTLALVNVAFSIGIAWITFRVGSRFFGKPTGLVAAAILALSPAGIHNTACVLTDTPFAFLTALAIASGLDAQSAPRPAGFFWFGLWLGLSALTRPTTKFFFLLIPVLALRAGARSKGSWAPAPPHPTPTPTQSPLPARPPITPRQSLRLGLLGCAVFLCVIAPWMARNAWVAGAWTLETNTGFNTLWSTMALVEPSTELERRTDPLLAQARDIVARSDTAYHASTEVRRVTGLTEAQVDKLMMRIGITVVFRHPIGFAQAALRNLFNVFTGPAAVQEILRHSRLTSPDIDRPCADLVREGLWRPACVNLGTRLLSLIVYVLLPALGASRALRASRGGSAGALAIEFLLVTIAYHAGLTSLVAGSDRYRLPVEPALALLAALALVPQEERGEAPTPPAP